MADQSQTTSIDTGSIQPYCGWACAGCEWTITEVRPYRHARITFRDPSGARMVTGDGAGGAYGLSDVGQIELAVSDAHRQIAVIMEALAHGR